MYTCNINFVFIGKSLTQNLIIKNNYEKVNTIIYTN